MDLQTFLEGNFSVRIAHDHEGEPLFVLKDLCACLGIKNHRDVAVKLDSDETVSKKATTSKRGQQMTTFVTEPGLYSVLLRCNASKRSGTQAWHFRRWVTHKVLPQIRKSGVYELTKQVEQLKLRNTALETKNRERNVQQIIDSDAATKSCVDPTVGAIFIKRYARKQGWPNKDLYNDKEVSQLVSAFRQHIKYDCRKDAMVFAV